MLVHTLYILWSKYQYLEVNSNRQAPKQWEENTYNLDQLQTNYTITNSTWKYILTRRATKHKSLWTLFLSPLGLKCCYQVLVKIHSIFDKLNITEYNESHLYHGHTGRYNHGDNVIYPVR